jgi:hypothetical protein
MSNLVHALDPKHDLHELRSYIVDVPMSSEYQHNLTADPY